MLKRSLPALALLLLSASVPTFADSLVTLKTHVDAFEIMGRKQEARDADVKMWLAKDKVRRDDRDISTILRLDQKKLMLIDHKEKTYSVLTLPVDLLKVLPAEHRKELEALLPKLRMEVSVKNGDETRKIGSWNTRKVQVSMNNEMGMRVTTDFWVSPEVEVDRRLYTQLSATLASLQPGTGDLISQLEKIEGFPVLQESTMTVMGQDVRSREELISVETKEAPADLFEPPAGYTLEEFNPLARRETPR
jgi:hypothetical protein